MCPASADPADESDRLKRAGLYVDMEAGGRISEPPEITADEAAGSVGLARQATTSAGGLILASQFQAWLADPPAEALDISEDLVTTLTEADARTPDAAANVIHRTVERFTARRE